MKAVTAHLGGFFGGQRCQILMHYIPAPLSLNCLELLDAAVICSRIGAAGALLHVRMRVAATIGHAPPAK